jgi:putative ABC transport system permease protein
MRAAAKALGQPFQGNGLPIAQVVALTGGPVLVAAVATAGVLFATSANTVRDTVLLRVAGASRGRLALGAIFESLMYAVTSALAAALALALNSAAFALALRLGPVPGAGWVGLPLPPFVIVGGGLVLMLAVALPTAAWVANRQPMRILGAD